MKDFIGKIGKKALITTVMFIILVIVILFGGAFLYNKSFYKKSYKEIEDIMLNAGKEYYADHSDRLPKELNGKISISASALAKAGKMKDIKDYVKDDDIKCSGKVSVTNLGKSYRYVPDLDCGDSYKTKYFIDYLKKKNTVTEDGDGLYNLNDEFVFRGEDVNNYVMFYTQMDKYRLNYRIVKFTEDYIVLIYTAGNDSIVWDDKYNVDRSDSTGVNDYKDSYVNKYLQKMYADKSVFNSYAKNLIIPHSVSIGKRSETDSEKNGSLEKATVLDNQFVSLLPLYDFLNASLDKNCNSSISPACQNNNYLGKFKYSWWTLTGDKSNSYKVFKITDKSYGNGGYPVLSTANSDAKPRFVVYVSKDALLVSGKGTKSSPYMIK